MTLRTSCFDRGLFLKTLRRFWPLWLGYLFLWLLDLPLSLYDRYSFRAELPLGTLQRYILGSLGEDCVFITFAAAPLAAMAVFSHLYNERSCGVYASLPIKRESGFYSVMLAGLVPLALAHVVTFAATTGVSAALGHLPMGTLLTWLCGSLLELLFFYGFAVLCAQLTGHILIVPAVYAVLSFTAVVVELILGGLLEMFLYGYAESSGNFAAMLSPVVWLMRRVGSVTASVAVTPEGYTAAATYGLNGWSTLLIYAGIGLGLLALSLVLYKKRRMESAGDTVALRPLRPVFKYALAGGCSLVLGIVLAGLFYNDARDTVFGLSRAPGIALCCLLGGFMGYFGAEMLNRKTFRVFGSKKGWLGFGCFALAVLAGVAALETDVTGFETRTPDPGKVSTAIISFSGGHVTYAQEDAASAVALHERIIATREVRREPGEPTRYVTVSYILTNGEEFRRRYNVPINGQTTDLLREAEDLLNAPAARKSRGFNVEGLNLYWFGYCTVNAGTFQLSLDREEAYAFYTECILPDLLEGKLDRIWLLEDSVYQESTYKVSIHMQVTEPVDASQKDDRYSKTLYLTPTTESLRVNRWLTEHGVPMVPAEASSVYEKYGPPQASVMEIPAGA